MRKWRPRVCAARAEPAERHRRVDGIEQPIELRTAGFHPRGEFGVLDFLPPHQRGKLPSDKLWTETLPYSFHCAESATALCVLVL
jgi:hypothetical protein